MAEGGPCVRVTRMPASAIRDVDAVHGIVVKQSQKRVDHSHHVANNLLTLLRGGANSDVTFVVGGKVFNAHRIILAAQCEYFRLLLFGNMVEAHPGVEIEVKDASPESFHFLLEYLYCGRLDLASLTEHTVLELLALADKYNLVDLLKSICVYLGGIVNISNVCQILTYADMHQLEKLQKKCLMFVDNNALDVMKSESFCVLPESLLIAMLKRDSFFAHEMSIFKGCVRWAEHNQKHGSEELTRILQVIRLYRLTLDEIFNIVRPKMLFAADELLEAIRIKHQGSYMEIRERGLLTPDHNMATPELGAQVVEGTCPSYALNRDGKCYTFHSFEHNEGITIELGEFTIINHIRMTLYDRNEECYPYQVFVSRDQQHWDMIVDYSSYLCRAEQHLYFPKVIAKYIRVIGLLTTSLKCVGVLSEGDPFKLVSFECYYSEPSIPVMNNSLLVPTKSVVNITCQEDLFVGFYDGDFIYHFIDDGGFIMFQLNQPYLVSSMRFRIYPNDESYSQKCTFDYQVQVADVYLNEEDYWEVVADVYDAKMGSWQHISFEQRIVCWILISGIACSDQIENNEFRISHIECPMAIENNNSNS